MPFQSILKGAILLNVNEIVEWIGILLILLGAIFSVISAIGLVRLPDVYTRVHAASKSSTLAVLVCLFGAFLYFWGHFEYVSVRLLLGIIFVFITSPVAGHLTLRAAYRSRVPLAEGSGDDELKPVLFGEDNATPVTAEGVMIDETESKNSKNE